MSDPINLSDARDAKRQVKVDALDKRHAVELRAMAMRLIEMQMERRKVALPPGMSVALQGIQSAVNQLDLEQDHPQ